MKRGAGRGKEAYLPKPEKVDVPDKYVKIRIAAAVISLVIAAASISYGVVLLTGTEKGWQTVTASAGGAQYAADFVLTYELGASGKSARTENRELKQLYTEACLTAGRAFDAGTDGFGGAGSLGAAGGSAAGAETSSAGTADSSAVGAETSSAGTAGDSALGAETGSAGADDSSALDAETASAAAFPGSLGALNAAPGESVELEPVLYEALSLMEQYGDRSVYLGPAYRLYENVFTCTQDWQLDDYDPARNEALRELFGRIVAFARDPDSVRVELLGENRARLCLSEEYRAFLDEEELGGALDFGWMKNAFLTDYIADTLKAAGFTRGNISSFDGYVRNLDGESGTGYSLNLFDFPEDTAIQAARLDYRGAKSFVSYRNFPVTAEDARRVCLAADGSRKTLYLSLEDGLPRTGADSLTAYSDSLGCAQIMLQTSPVFLQKELSEAALRALAEEGVQTVWARDRKLLTTDADAALSALYDGYEAEIVK